METTISKIRRAIKARERIEIVIGTWEVREVRGWVEENGLSMYTRPAGYGSALVATIYGRIED